VDIFKVASNAIVGAKSARNDDGEGKEEKKRVNHTKVQLVLG